MSQRKVKWFLSFLTVGVLLVGGVSAPAAADSFSVGTINGQGGWTCVTPPTSLAQGIEADAAHTGTQAWQMSNSPDGSVGGLNDRPYSPALSVAAGRPASGKAADTMTASIWFKPVSNAADGSAVEVDLAGNGARDMMGFLIYDASGLSFKLNDADTAYETGTNPPPWEGTRYINVFSNIDPSAWHKLTLTIVLNDPGDNQWCDVLSASLDDVASTVPGAQGLVNHYGDYARYGTPTLNDLYFRAPSWGTGSAIMGAPSTAQGFYFDDVSLSTYNSSDPGTILASYSTSFEAPEPATMALLTLGGLAMLRRRRAA